MADIELVIKIPDRIHYGIEKGITVNGSEASQIVLDAVKNGTPLPKNHGRLIDADALDVDNLDRAYDNNFELDFGRLYTADVIDMIANATTIIEADKEED